MATRVVFACGDYPMFGGAATNAYALTKWVDAMAGYRAICVVANPSGLSQEQLDPDKKGFVCHVQDWESSDVGSNITELLEGVPDVIYAKKCSVGWCLQGMFPEAKTHYILSSVISSELDWSGKDKSLLQSHETIPKCIRDLTFTDASIVANSEASKRILLNFNSKANIRVAYTSVITNQNGNYTFLELPNARWASGNPDGATCLSTPGTYTVRYVPEPGPPEGRLVAGGDWEQREYDIGFASSCCDRSVKNIKLFLDIASASEFRHKQKIVIGRNSQRYKGIHNCTCLDLLDHDLLIARLSSIKLIMITSHYESLSNFMMEAANQGCNVLVSDTVGGSEFIDDRCIAHSKDDFVEKAKTLLREQVECIKSEFDYTERQLFDDLLLGEPRHPS
jgi:hypothetical protein